MGKVFWENEYKNRGKSVFGKPSKEVVEIVERLESKSRILDIACGDGRHSFYCGSKGHSVDAFDINKDAIEGLKEKVRELDIRLTNCSIDDYLFKDEYNLIIAHGILQFISKESRECLIEKMKSHTKVGGYNIIAVFTDKVEAPKDLEKALIGIFKEGEIKEYYKDWEIELVESYIFRDEHEGGLKHTHAINKLVARKI